MEKKKTNNKLIGTIVIILLVLLAVYLLIFTSVFNKPLTSEEASKRSIIATYDIDDDDPDFLNLIAEPQSIPRRESFSYAVIDSYSQYQEVLAKLESNSPSYAEELKSVFENSGYEKSYFKKHSLLLLEDAASKGSSLIAFVNTDGGDINIRINWKTDTSDECYYPTDKDNSLYIIPVLKKSLWTADITVDMKRIGIFFAKPVIYLYPEEETQVTVKLGFKDKIIVSYPEYADGWNVLAKPDGKLVYNETGRKLYSLYYESNNAVDFKIQKDGFVVKKEDTVRFFEEKLAILGLNEYEAEEFIIYWLPILQANEYNYIRFATSDEIERNMPLEINPNPDIIIRVAMTFKGLNAPIEVEEQKLTTPTRTGFVAVEWGGTEITE